MQNNLVDKLVNLGYSLYFIELAQIMLGLNLADDTPITDKLSKFEDHQIWFTIRIGHRDCILATLANRLSADNLERYRALIAPTYFEPTLAAFTELLADFHKDWKEISQNGTV